MVEPIREDSGQLQPANRRAFHVVPAARRADGYARDGALTASRLRHDIQHEMATIRLLAELVGSADEAGTTSGWAVQLGQELRWLDQLLSAYDEVFAHETPHEWSPPADGVRLDVVAGEAVAALRCTSIANVRVIANPVSVFANPLALWRALRNLVDNAVRAAGNTGHLEVRVDVEAPSWAVVQIDDDGPGFGSGPNGVASLGLGIVQDFAVAHGGAVEIHASKLGGCCVRLLLPMLADLTEPDDDKGYAAVRDTAGSAAALR